MTGVEAVSNGVPLFKEPRTAGARRTLTAIIGILIALLAGIAILASTGSVAHAQERTGATAGLGGAVHAQRSPGGQRTAIGGMVILDNSDWLPESARVLRAWQGLGYDRRALALRRAAIEIAQGSGGKIGDDVVVQNG